MILVAGGTGRLGTLLVRRLRTRGEDVRVLTREATRAAHLADLGVEVCIGDVRRAETLSAATSGVTTVVSAVQGFAGPGGVSPTTVDRDGNAHLVDAVAEADATLVLLSIVGASADSPFELFRMKHAAEAYVAASGVPSTIVRSTAFADLWIDLLRQTAKRSGRPVVFGRGDNPVNMVAVDDVAAVVDELLKDPPPPAVRRSSASRRRVEVEPMAPALASLRSAGRSGHVSLRSTQSVIEVGGPGDVTFNDLAAAVQRADGRSSSPRHVPPAALRVLAASVGRLKPELGRQMRAAIEMDRVALTWPATHDPGTEARVGRTTTSELLGLATS